MIIPYCYIRRISVNDHPFTGLDADIEFRISIRKQKTLNALVDLLQSSYMLPLLMDLTVMQEGQLDSIPKLMEPQKRLKGTI